jgi:uncharacterized protein
LETEDVDMNDDDRAAILDLFQRLREVEARSGPREPGADALIRTAIAEQPGAPYYMAQTIIVQNQALREAERRLVELEAGPEDQGLFSGLFGRSEPARSSVPAAGPQATVLSARGDGFLAGAAQTALGVAGGVLLADILADTMSSGGEAEAAPDDSSETEMGGGEDHGDFDIGDF